ncbi:hypothetical protein L598_000700001270 [Mesorhizobium sp. J18]|uniref:DUF551 domain-containing protein n=1 Tax=Mesorhizobium sp. J18 TaxID=935263 RepID=UPI001198EB58|nr:DUF551 domain-containing protein [Mesorhizobium sp. J18]TWG90370.1 hypothetical protein L598_000700001270 [Mesorhizobium sp. J18]
MSEISEKEIAAARKAAGLTFTGTWLDNMVIAALEAAAHARAEAVEVKVKPLDAARLAEAEREITEYQRERLRWIDYATDLQRIIEALCNRRALPEPVSTARHHYEMARSALAHPAVPEGWQPIETAPENDHALFYVEDDGVYLDCLDRDGALLAASGDERIFATHWMPLPKPPVAAAEKEGE